MKIKNKFIAICLSFTMISVLTAQNNVFRYDINSDLVVINERTVETVNDVRLSNNIGFRLKQNFQSALNDERDEPDIIINIRSLFAGKYIMTSYAVPDAKHKSLLTNATSKYESIYFKLQFDNMQPIKRVITVPWDRPLQTTGIFFLNGESQKLSIWLPKGIHLEYIELAEYLPPKVPEKISNYKPHYIPKNYHPRLWVTSESLPIIKSRLTIGENAPIWDLLKSRARKPFHINYINTEEHVNNQDLETAALEKAFFYLMEHDKNSGNEAVKLIDSYLPFVEYGNILGITREIGRTIYVASIVYDWCYPLLNSSQKKNWIDKMLQLAEQMEIEWPPFRQSIVNGHGNEAQLCRDLLSMAIATYDENPIAYRYCSYRILEELIPMKQFEYQSPRHPQGVNYGDYRLMWDLHTAWIYKRMVGKEVFDPNINNVFKFWTYMRTPDGQMLRDGDAFNAPVPGKTYYWQRPITRFLAYTYNEDPFEKAEFIRQGGKDKIEPYLFLLLNQPEIIPDYTYNYPLTLDFGDITGGMIARTGWESPDDVLVEIRGGGYRNGAHQHADAGAIQLYYRGFLIGDIGMYRFAGTDYDVNFNRRSISHSMMLVNDPEENFGRQYGRKAYNDWGQKYNAPFPVSPQNAMKNPIFDNGKVISCYFGPSKSSPVFSYFSVDLNGPYSNKITNYVRNFCFINIKRKDVPGIIILFDDITTLEASFKKYWQVNSLRKPVRNENDLIFTSETIDGSIGKVHVNMLLPQERTTHILSCKNTFTVDGVFFDPPSLEIAEKMGNRILISPKIASKYDRFLTVFQITDGDTKTLPINWIETNNSYIIYVDNKIVIMSNNKELINGELDIIIPEGEKYQLAITGLEKGKWIIKKLDDSVFYSQEVKERENSIFLESIPAGNYIIFLE